MIHTQSEHRPFAELINELKDKIGMVFHNSGNTEQMVKEIMSVNPLSICIKEEYGGRGALPHEIIELLATTSYESLELCLTMGINSALFLQPFQKYGQEETKAPVLKRFLEEKAMGGLMITEPDFGSDALNMQTSYIEKNGKYCLNGTKHWAGLTGWADFWLVTARKQGSKGDLQRDIDFFLIDNSATEQNIKVEEIFKTLGLYAIPYGRNHIDLEVPVSHKLQPHTTGIKMMLDLLHSSRIQFPGMGMGFIKRMFDEALTHSRQRFIGGRSLLSYDQVQHRLSQLQSFYTICSAMCVNSCEKLNTHSDMAPHGLEVNAVKSLITDLMQESAQSAMQLIGAKSYKLNHIVGRGVVDSRPFKIFEGSNDILYAQITEGLIKRMKRDKVSNLYQFIKEYNLTDLTAGYVKELTNFSLHMEMSQRKSVGMGKIVARIISLNQVLHLAQKGFRKDLTDGAANNLQEMISQLMTGYSFDNKVKVTEDYQENSNWFSFV